MAGNKVRRILLIGFRATGKSTVGRILARKVGWDFVDLDDYVEEKAGKSIREMVEEGGWEAFRKKEREALREFSPRERLVLALGGGAVRHREEMESLRDGALVVWLCARPETILRRLSADPRTQTQRPSLTGRSWEEEVVELLREREPLYRHFADLALCTDALSPEEIARKILEELKPRITLE